MKLNFILKRVRQRQYYLPAIKIFYVCIFLLTFFIPVFTQAQSKIAYAEYYLDQDPGLNNGTPIAFTSAVNVTNVSVNINVNSLSRGVHIFGTRARTASGVWSMSNYWYIFKPYIAIVPSIQTNIIRVEYYVDKDPGIGNGLSVNITPGTNLSNISFTINSTPLALGTHIVGTRALTSDGLWSNTNFWLFYKPFSNIIAAGTPANINYVEYYMDQDPGIGNATNVSITPGINLSNINIPVNISSASNGQHIIGIRGKDQSGNWSITNYWLFVKPYSNKMPTAISNTKAVEYYLDYDPGYGKATPVPITSATNLSNLNVNVDLTGIIAGTHNINIRSKDSIGNWSFVNSWQFNIPGTPPVFSSLVSTTTLCAGSSVNVGYQLSSPISLKANNQFIAQLSDNTGSFNSPVTIGTISSTNNTTNSFTCVIPANTVQSGTYRIRVVSTNQSVVATDNGTDITIYSLPSKPVYISPKTDTTICKGNQFSLQASNDSYGYYQYQWYQGNNPISGATALVYTVPSAGVTDAGIYKLVVANYYSNTCIISTTPINITINTNVPAIPTISPNGTLGVCLGNSTILTSTNASSYQWYDNGVAITGATKSTYNVSIAGTYSVVTGNGTSCFAPSSNNAIITLGLAATKPNIISSGSDTICQGSSINLTSTAFSGNQWLFNGVAISGQTGTTLSASQTGYYKTQVSGSGCSVTSDSVLVTVNNNVVASVVLTASISNGPPGSLIAFTATPTNGGNAPMYSFSVNSIVVQSGTSNTYTANTFSNGDNVSCILSSNAVCASPATAASNSLTVNFASPISINGNFATPLGTQIPGVTARLSGGKIDSINTDVTGSYLFSLYPDNNYSISGYKNNDYIKADGVNVLDLIKIQSHILGITPLGNPYKIIAADVNGDAAINVFDMVFIKRLILGIDTTFTNTTSGEKRLWAFVDSSYTFPNPSNPFPYNAEKSYNNLNATVTSQSFTGVKLGDVTFDWSPVVGFNKPGVTLNKVKLYYDTVYSCNSNEISIKLKVSNFTSLAGVQFALNFNADVFTYEGIEANGLNFDINEQQASKGLLSFLWVNTDGRTTTLNDGYTLFEIKLQKKKESDMEDINIDASLEAIAYDGNSVILNVVKTGGLILNKVLSETVSESLLVYPNPTSTNNIQITVKAADIKNITIQLFDTYGRLIYQKDKTVTKGINDFKLELGSQILLQEGVYYLKVKGLAESIVKPVVVLKDK